MEWVGEDEERITEGIRGSWPIGWHSKSHVSPKIRVEPELATCTRSVFHG